MRAAEKKRKQQAATNGLQVGIKWHWLPGNRVPRMTSLRIQTAKRRRKGSVCFSLQMTQVLGTSHETEQSTSALKAAMNLFEKNDSKAESLKFGKKEAGIIRILEAWMDPTTDVKKRLKRLRSL